MTSRLPLFGPLLGCLGGIMLSSAALMQFLLNDQGIGWVGFAAAALLVTVVCAAAMVGSLRATTRDHTRAETVPDGEVSDEAVREQFRSVAFSATIAAGVFAMSSARLAEALGSPSGLTWSGTLLMALTGSLLVGVGCLVQVLVYRRLLRQVPTAA